MGMRCVAAPVQDPTGKVFPASVSPAQPAGCPSVRRPAVLKRHVAAAAGQLQMNAPLNRRRQVRRQRKKNNERDKPLDPRPLGSLKP